MRTFPLLALLALTASVPALADDALLKLTVAQHRAARETIRTFSAEYEYKKVQPDVLVVAAGRYTRTPKTVLVTNGRDGIGTLDILVRDGEARGVGKRWTKDGIVQHNGVRSSAAKPYSLGEVWPTLLLSTDGPGGTVMPHDELYARAKRPPQASKVTLDGRECVKVEVAYDVQGFDKPLEINLAVWHDVQRNSLVLRREYRQVGGDVLHAFQILEFQEPAPGVVVPVKSQIKVFGGSKLVSESEVSLRNVRVNTAIPEQSLALPPLPHGSHVSDRITEQDYTADSNWNRIGPATAAPAMRIQSGTLDGDLFSQPSVNEPPGFPQWIILASVAVFAVAVLWFGVRIIRRRIRAKNVSPTE